ncbi:flavin monoamine oxidase family protein [Sphingomonas sp. C3-2]|uniref:flavin monoamine oxidase family protein n=1 Tax=Sphingomonas sp. C3-2 TaxID=3062169 RepID=UPI00294ADCC2|nr:FAD-dependent oxidoreductase [Sphingomonas sp. C3-2]WOK37919.1 FAD-dependent oxidoreductase [Sphingomonas sp. C3-2]
MRPLSRRHALIGASAALVAGAAPRMAWGKTEADVIVIGAGLAGLAATTQLEAAGARVVLLEAAQRIGGRMHTLDDLPGRPEAGGVQVGSGYHRVLGLAKAHGIGLEPAPSIERNALYVINGQSVTMRDWATTPANRLIGPERAVPPAALGGFYGARFGPLAGPEAWTGASAAALDIPYAQALANLGASAEALRLIDANLNGNSIHTLSALQLARTAAIFRASPGQILMLTGGSQRLPEAMAAALKAQPRLGQLVTGIAETADGVRVTLAGGRTLSARHCICTIPFAALRTIAVEAPIGRDMASMIAGLPYSRASFAYLAASDPFWKQDGLPETIWSDDPLIGRVFALGDDPAVLKVWLSGPNADQLDRLAPDVAAAEIIRRIEAARPSAKGKLRLLRVHSWQKNPFARGIYHHIAPGQGAALAAATLPAAGRLHFAGEHLGRNDAGMEAALESGESAARTVATRL